MHTWKTAPVGKVQRGVANANGDVRAVAENAVTASVIVRALNEYENVRTSSAKLGELRDMVSNALLLLDGKDVLQGDDTYNEAIEMLRQIVEETDRGRETVEARKSMVRVTFSPVGLGSVFSPSYTIADVPGSGTEHVIQAYGLSARMDWA